jgi:hypothetical protein
MYVFTKDSIIAILNMYYAKLNANNSKNHLFIPGLIFSWQ